jgi:hypothetical protein
VSLWSGVMNGGSLNVVCSGEPQQASKPVRCRENRKQKACFESSLPSSRVVDGCMGACVDPVGSMRCMFVTS